MFLCLIIHARASSPAALVHQSCWGSSQHLTTFFALFFFLTLSQRRVLQTISKMTLENNVSLSRSNHLQDCTSVWRARQFFTLFSVGVGSPPLPSCFRVGNTFLNQNSCLILSLASSSRLQAVTDSFLHLVVITTA